MKILYIAGQGRCGSTLLGMLLDQQPGFAYVGEVMNLWGQWDADNSLCSCGAILRYCPFWSPVMDSCCADIGPLDRATLFETQTEACRTAKVPLWMNPWWRRHEHNAHAQYFGQLSALYQSIFDLTSASVLVDASKVPTYGMLLKLLHGVDVYVLQLIRDPRAVAYSWTRQKRTAPDSRAPLMPTQSPLRSAIQWVGYNAAIPLLHARETTRFMTLSYEGLANDPDNSLQLILRFIHETPTTEGRPEMSRSNRPGESHSVSGNPNRFLKGPLSIQIDEAWRDRMAPRDRSLVSLATWPLRRFHGYN